MRAIYLHHTAQCRAIFIDANELDLLERGLE